MDPREKTCERKTASGNVYTQLFDAWWVADRLPRIKSNRNATVYTCPICGKYHIGRPTLFSQGKRLAEIKEKRRLMSVLARDVRCQRDGS